MIRQLPKFSFKRYMRTSAVDVEAPEKLVETIRGAIEEAARAAKPDPVRLLVFTIFVDDPEMGPVQYEFRAWVSPDKVTMVGNIDHRFDPSRAYRVIIEEFEVSAIAASFDSDSASHLGFEPVILPLTGGLELKLRQLLRLEKPVEKERPEPASNVEEEPARKEREDGRGGLIEKPRLGAGLLGALVQGGPRPRLLRRREEPAREPPKPAVEVVAKPASNGGDGISRCLSRIWEECVYGDCNQPSDLRKALEEDGFAVVGKGAEYYCVVRGERRHCRYFVIVMGPGKIETDCLSSIDEAVRLLEEKVKAEGYLTVLS